MEEKDEIQRKQSAKTDKHTHCLRVLVVGNTVGSYLRHGLEKRGCHCSFEPSIESAIKLVSQNDFDLIVCTIPFEEEHPFISQLVGSKCTVLYCHPVQGTWLPIMSHGKKCFGAPALSPIAVIELVDRLASSQRNVAAA